MKIIFLFPGYGTHFVGMCKELYDDSRLMQEYFEEASNCLGFNFLKLCFASSDADLTHMARAYPALFLISASVNALLQDAGIKPDAVAGFGLGEYAALFAARSLNFPDGLYLLSKLSLLYQPLLDPEAFRALRVADATSRQLNKILVDFDDDAAIAYYILENEHIITGTAEAIEEIIAELKSEKIKYKNISLSYGLYSALAHEVVQSFKPYMAKVDIKDLKVPLISGIDGKEITKGYAARDRIVKSLTSPVRLPHIIKKLSEYDIIIEVGPPSSYLDQLRSQFTKSTVLSVSKPEDLALTKEICAEIIVKPQEKDIEKGE